MIFLAIKAGVLPLAWGQVACTFVVEVVTDVGLLSLGWLCATVFGCWTLALTPRAILRIVLHRAAVVAALYFPGMASKAAAE